MGRIAKLLVILLVLAAPAAAYFIAGNREASDLEVGQISPASPSYPDTAIPYALPQKTLILTTTTVVTNCVETPSGERIHGTTSLVVTSSVGIDPDQQYYIYFENGARSKNLDYSVELYDSGTLKSASVSIRDQVAPIATSVTGSLVQLALQAPALALGARGAPPPSANCANLNAALKENPSDPRLTLLQEDRWVPQLGRDGQLGYSVNVSLERILQQFNLSNPRWAASNARIAIRLEDAIVPHSGEVKFVSSTCPSDDVKCRTQPQKPPLVKGLVLRNAVRVRLTTAVCDAACNAATLSPLPHPGDPLTERPSSEETIPQFGARFLIPVHSGFAQDVALSVALNPDGLITKLQMQSTSALSSNVTTVGGQVSELASGLASPDKATTAANKNLADCLSAQQQVINAGRSPIGTCR